MFFGIHWLGGTLRRLGRLTVLGGILLIALSPFRVDAHQSANIHAMDLLMSLGGNNKTPLGDIARDISACHDQGGEYFQWFKKEFGAVGNHRNLGHGAPFGGRIPQSYLSEIRRRYGEEGVRKVVEKQRELSTRFRDKIMKAVPGLGKKEARALMRHFSICHIFGDHTYDNSAKFTPLVRKLEDAINLEKTVLKDLFGTKNAKYYKKMLKELERIQMSGLSNAEKAKACIELMGKTRFAEQFRAAYGKLLKGGNNNWDVNQAVNRNEKLAERYASTDTYGKVKKSETATSRSAHSSPKMGRHTAEKPRGGRRRDDFRRRRPRSRWRVSGPVKGVVGFAGRAMVFPGWQVAKDVFSGNVSKETFQNVGEIATTELGTEFATRVLVSQLAAKIARKSLEKSGKKVTSALLKKTTEKVAGRIVGGSVQAIFGTLEMGSYIKAYNNGNISMRDAYVQCGLIAVTTGGAIFFTCTEKGAEIGAAVGTFFFPGLGTGVGAAVGTGIGIIIGGVGGAASGGYTYYSAYQKEQRLIQEEANRNEWQRDRNFSDWRSEIEQLKNSAMNKRRNAEMLLGLEGSQTKKAEEEGKNTVGKSFR